MDLRLDLNQRGVYARFLTKAYWFAGIVMTGADLPTPVSAIENSRIVRLNVVVGDPEPRFAKLRGHIGIAWRRR